MKTSPIQGGCLCGEVRYEVNGTPYNITHCHCEDCRRSSGAPFATWASFRRADFRFTAGNPREVFWAGRIREFCRKCGTPLTFLSSADTDEIDVTVCTFDSPASVQAADHTWTIDRLPWIQLNDGLPEYPKDRDTRAG